MNRHQLSELRCAYEQYQTHLDHTTRLIAAINEGRLQPRASSLFPSRFTASVRKLRSVRAVRGERTARSDRTARGQATARTEAAGRGERARKVA